MIAIRKDGLTSLDVAKAVKQLHSRSIRYFERGGFYSFREDFYPVDVVNYVAELLEEKGFTVKVETVKDGRVNIFLKTKE